MNKLTGQYHYTGGEQDLETETPATLYQPVQEKRERWRLIIDYATNTSSITLYSYYWYMYCSVHVFGMSLPIVWKFVSKYVSLH